MNRADDEAVTGLGAPHSRPRPPSRACGLLVCALLLGLLGMHGLGPVPPHDATAGHHRTTATAHTGAEMPTPGGAVGDRVWTPGAEAAVRASMPGMEAAVRASMAGMEAAVRASMPGACGHDADGGTGHLQHADPACASASVGQAPVVAPVLVPDVVAWSAQADARASMTGSGPEGGRAPPSLAELQLLRI